MSQYPNKTLGIFLNEPTWTRAVGRAADGDCEVPGEEGQPAEEEGAEHDAQGDERLVLLAPRSVDAVPLTEP